MFISKDFIGGNIEVVSVDTNYVKLKCELRGSDDWFYWAFRVVGAAGQTITFDLQKNCIGYYGPAISYDNDSWHWLGEQESRTSFTYHFGKNEDEVYFAHHMLYHPDMFQRFCSLHKLETSALCISEKGRNVPFVELGDGDECVLLTARHHACESTGNYIMQGVMEELLNYPLPGIRIICVPFVDYDGVVEGDQGKGRQPHDHNRDYIRDAEPIYASVRALRCLATENNIRYAFDFHSPWHIGGENDTVFIVQKHYDTIKNLTRFGHFFEDAVTPEALPYFKTNDHSPDDTWNKSGSPCFATYMHATAGAELSLTLETAYFKAGIFAFTPERAIETGRCFARALHNYHRRSAKVSFTGDLLYQAPMNDLCKTEAGYDFSPLLFPLWHRLPNTDFLVGNVETPFAGEESGYTNERWCFNTPDAALIALKKIGFDLLTLANNHCMDRDHIGIVCTLEACKKNDISAIGLASSEAERNRVFTRNIKGIRVAFVNYTYGTNAFSHRNFLLKDCKYAVNLTQPEETLDGSIDLLADFDKIARETDELYNPNSPTVKRYLEQLSDDIRLAKENSDFVVMLLHSGGQYNENPDPYTRMLVSRIRDMGADIIITNHPHIILPSEAENGFFTAYCLGNLQSMYSQPHNEINPSYSAVVNLYLERSGGKINQRVSFSICRIVYREGKPPQTFDTYDIWKQNQTEEIKSAILYYANRFMPGQNYTKPMAEYPITF
mgnify:FL=1